MKRARSSSPGLLLALALGAGLAVALPSASEAANSDGGGSGEGSFYAYTVEFSGDVSERRRGSVPRPPPRCWWTPVPWADPYDAEDVASTYYELNIDRQHWQTDNPPESRLVSPDAFERAQEADAVDPGVVWMSLTYISSGPGWDPIGEKDLLDLGCTPQLNEYNGSSVAVSMHYYPVGQEPQPVIDPEDLARYALAVLDIEEPSLSWNPRIAGRNDATLVNLPTWVWVDEENAMRRLEVTARVGDLSVTVEARPDGLSVTSPGGGTNCTAKQARRAWSPSASEDDGCIVRFDRSSTGYPNGFPVVASTVWNATYTVNGSGDPISLPSLTSGETTMIPVAQSQALVTEVD